MQKINHYRGHHTDEEGNDTGVYTLCDDCVAPAEAKYQASFGFWEDGETVLQCDFCGKIGE